MDEMKPTIQRCWFRPGGVVFRRLPVVAWLLYTLLLLVPYQPASSYGPSLFSPPPGMRFRMDEYMQNSMRPSRGTWHSQQFRRIGSSSLHRFGRKYGPLAASGTSDTLDTLNSSGSLNCSEVVYKKTLMPRPQKNAPQSDKMSYVSWEEVLIAAPRYSGGDGPDNTGKDMTIATLLTVGATMILGLLISASGHGAWRYYLSGGLCAAISHSIPVPIDVVKTRKQVDPLLANETFPAAMAYMVKNEGLRSLWAGLGPTALGYLVEGAIKFGVYEAMKPLIKKLLVGAASLSTYLAFLNSHVLNLILCGIASGVAASIALCPMEALRIRVVAQKDSKINWIQAGLKMIKNEGVTSLSRGILPMFLKQVPYTVMKNVSFDLTTRAGYAFLRSRGIPLSSGNKIYVPVLSAALASILSCVSSQPGDMLLSLMNANEGEQRRTRNIIQDILRSDRGIGGFFVGIKTRFVHVGIIVTVQLFIYDVIKRLCGIAATGSE